MIFVLVNYGLLFCVFRHIGKDISNTFAKLEKLAICKWFLIAVNLLSSEWIHVLLAFDNVIIAWQ